MLNFGGKEQKTGGELIPKGTLAFGVVTFKAVKHSRETGGRFWDIELTIDSGEYQRRKVFDMVADPSDMQNKEGWRNMGFNAFKRMAENAGFDLSSARAETPEQARQLIDSLVSALEGRRVAFSIKVEEGTDGYADKNKVAEFLSPNPESGSHKRFQQLVNGGAPAAKLPFGSAQASAPPSATPAAGFSTPASAPNFGAPAQGFKPAVAPTISAPATAAGHQGQPATGTASLSKPTWLGKN